MAFSLVIIYGHVLAAIFLVGYLLLWVTMVGPIVKRNDPVRAAALLREIRRTFRGLGWVALGFLIASGIAILSYRGIGLAQLFSGTFLSSSYGLLLGTKLLFVVGLTCYEVLLGPQNTKFAWAGLVGVFSIVALSVLLVRAPAFLGR
jgi:uncharacterized membrane protein